jgi:hypothetical protein
MNPLKISSMLTVLFLASIAHAQMHPEIFDVSDVVMGAKRLPTRYLYAAGAWSDASETENALSVQIECYKRVDLCNVAQATIVGQGPGSVGVTLDGFDSHTPRGRHGSSRGPPPAFTSSPGDSRWASLRLVFPCLLSSSSSAPVSTEPSRTK